MHTGIPSGYIGFNSKFFCQCYLELEIVKCNNIRCQYDDDGKLSKWERKLCMHYARLLLWHKQDRIWTQKPSTLVDNIVFT